MATTRCRRRGAVGDNEKLWTYSHTNLYVATLCRPLVFPNLPVAGIPCRIYLPRVVPLICCTACLQAPSILGCSIDISGCSTIVSHINHPAEPLETILIGLWWW